MDRFLWLKLLRSRSTQTPGPPPSGARPKTCIRSLRRAIYSTFVETVLDYSLHGRYSIRINTAWVLGHCQVFSKEINFGGCHDCPWGSIVINKRQLMAISKRPVNRDTFSGVAQQGISRRSFSGGKITMYKSKVSTEQCKMVVATLVGINAGAVSVVASETVCGSSA